MKNILIYTFKSFPYKDALLVRDFYEFKKLNQDVKLFCRDILKYKPKLILGIAKSTNKYSTIEKYASNKFNTNGILIKGAPNKYELTIPDTFTKYFKIRNKLTTSFCNLSMFKIQHFIKENKLKTTFIFIHIAKDDLKTLKNIINNSPPLLKLS